MSDPLLDFIFSSTQKQPAAASPAPGAEVFDALLHQESGGRQFDKAGAPLKSSAGAIGIAQVMEATGPEAAGLAGVPWDRDRWLNDADYNKAIGKAYFQKQLTDFGSVDQALAAYNAGPGAVRKALSAAQREGKPDGWLSRLPEETQKYVPAILAKSKTPLTGAQASQPVAQASDPRYYSPANSELIGSAPKPATTRTAGEAITDTAIGLGSGLLQGIGLLAGSFGADNAVAKGARVAADDLTAMQSPARQEQRAARAAEIKFAEEYGSTWDEVKAYAGSFTDAPVETVLNAVGTSAPTLLMAVIPGLNGAAAARLIAAGAMGAAQGAGSVKGEIFEAVQRKLIEKGVDPDTAAKAAAGAQAYDGPNLDQIMLGMGIGAAAATTGFERAVASVVSRRAGAEVAEQAAGGVAKRIATGVAKESPVEALQGGQERVASNVALQREGFDVPTFQGAAGQATLEGLASAPLGAAGGMLHPTAAKAREPNTPLSKAATAGNAATEAAPQPAAPAPVDPAQRLAELESISAGSSDAQNADGQTTPGQPGRFFTADEKSEYDALKSQRDATPGAVPDEIGPKALAARDALRANRGLLDALRADTSPVKPQALLKDLSIASSKSAQPAMREQALARVEMAMDWAAANPAAEIEADLDALPGLAKGEDRPQGSRPTAAQLRAGADRDAELLAERDGQRPNQVGNRTRDEADRREQAAIDIESAPAAPPEALDRAVALRQQAASLRRQADELDARPGAAGTPGAMTERDRAGIDEQRQANLERNMRAPAAPAAAPAAPAPAPIAPTEQAGIEASALAGKDAQRRAEDNPRQVVIDRAMRNIEERGGVASPAEARILQGAGAGKPYDRIDESLAGELSTDEKLTQATGIALGNAPRESTRQGQPSEAVLVAQEQRDRSDSRMQALAADRAAAQANRPTERDPAAAPAADEVIGSLKTIPALRTAEQKSLVDIARRSYTAEQMRVMNDAAVNPANLSATDKLQLQQMREARKSEERQADPQALPDVAIPAGAGPAFLRKRRAQVEAAVAQGFETVERRDGVFVIRNSRTGSEMRLSGRADAALAREAVRKMVDERAHAAATSPKNERKEPTDAQKMAGNYKLGMLRFDGLDVAIENPEGSVRSGVGKAGKKWSVRMKAHYGYIRRTTGADGDGVDIYLHASPTAGAPVFVIDQYNDDGTFDETKSIVGARTRDEAIRIYDAHFSDGSGPRRRGDVTQMGVEEFKAWAKSDAAKRPAGASDARARNLPDPGVQQLAKGEKSLRRSGGPGVPAVRGQGDQDARGVGAELRGVPAGRGAAPDASTLPGPDQGGQGLRAGQREVGDATGAEPEQAGLRARTDAQRGDKDGGGVGSRPGSSGRQDLQTPEAGDVSGASAGGGDSASRVGGAQGVAADIATQVEPETGSFTVRMDGKNVRFERRGVDALGEQESPERDGRATRISKRSAALIKAIAQALGKRVVFFADVDGVRPGDGFVVPNEPDTIYLNEVSTINPLAVMGHEFLHTLRQTNPKAWDAIAAVVKTRVKDAKGFRRDYYGAEEAEARGDGALDEAQGSELEELVSDLGGNLMADPKFWEDVFAKIRADNGAEAKGIIARLIATLQSMIDKIVGVVKGPKYKADGFVTELDAIRAAYRDGLAAHLQRAGESKAGMQAEVLKSAQREKLPQIETPEFKKWFGQSKAVDRRTGQPRIVYHGTAGDIRQFKYQGPEKARHVDLGVGPAFYFSNDPGTADWYANDSSRQTKGRKGAAVYPVYLSMQNPRIVDFGRTGIEGLYEELETAKKSGNDGLIAYRYDDGGVSDHYVVFSPSQIKSATGNSGKFSATNHDITKSPERGIHFSKRELSSINGVYYGTGLKGAEAERLRDSSDARLKTRVFAYIDEGNGVRPEAGVGGIAHEVKLPRLYDAKANPEKLWNGGDLNATESRILDAGYGGYFVKKHETGQGFAVIIGDAAKAVPAKRITDPKIQSGVASLPPETISKGLMSKEMNSVDTSAIPGAKMRAGILTIPVESRDAANAEMARIGSPIRFSAERLSTAADEIEAVRKMYGGSDKWMKAPNGNASNLTQRQWLHVRTPSFRAWFGDWLDFAERGVTVWDDDAGKVSKAVDSNGEPLILYHGTDKGGFAEFRKPGGKKRGDLGIFTSDDLGMARSYVTRGRGRMIVADEVSEDQNNGGGEAAVYSLFLNIRNPNESDFEGASWSGERPGQFVVMNADGDIVSSDNGQSYFDDREDAFALVMQKGGNIEAAPDHWEDTDSVVRDAARSKTQDGAIIRRVIDHGPGNSSYTLEPVDVFVALNPNQVKSADFNSGEYSVTEDDIRKSVERSHTRVHEFEVSTRAPSAKPTKSFEPEDAKSNLLISDFVAGLGQEKWLSAVTDLVETYPNYRAAAGAATPEKKLERMVKQMVENLVWLHDQVPAATRGRSKLWYDGARAIAERWVKKYGISDAQAAGMLAALSPQKDWFMNVSLANRVADIMSERQAFRWSKQMDETAARIFGKEAYQEDIAEIRGKTLQDLDDAYLRAMWLRVYDQAHNPASFYIVSPEGDFIAEARTKDGTLGRVAWGGNSTIAKAVSIFEDGSFDNISSALGRKHKVRNFYNNILVPNSPNGHVTIDTHAVAAALLRPLSGNSVEVMHNFGGPKSAHAGLEGLYALYEEAYRRAAAERGILPREMQSITWEAIRGLYVPTFKAQKRNVDAVDAVWEQYSKGRLSYEKARQQVFELGGRIDPPSWEGRDPGAYVEDEEAADDGDLSEDGVSAGDSADDGGAAGRGAGASARRSAARITDFDARNIGGILEKTDWAILTAENPRGQQASPEFNEAAQKRLRADLSKLGAEFRDIEGSYGQKENSIAVAGITETQATELGRKYDQDSILTRKGLIYQDGSINPAGGVEVFREAPEDFYSRIGDTIFRINIDFDTRLPAMSPDQDLVDLFEDLASSGQRKKRAEAAADSHPRAQQIKQVNDNILDLLEELESKGSILINCD